MTGGEDRHLGLPKPSHELARGDVDVGTGTPDGEADEAQYWPPIILAFHGPAVLGKAGVRGNVARFDLAREGVPNVPLEVGTMGVPGAPHERDANAGREEADELVFFGSDAEGKLQERILHHVGIDEFQPRKIIAPLQSSYTARIDSSIVNV